MASYHLEILDGTKASGKTLKIFGRAHYTYINQIFGDQTVREIIQEVWGKPGKLVVEPAGENFEHSDHHIFQPHKTKKHIIVCSAQAGYQNIDVDVNDTLCQSYSLLSYFGVPFDSTPSDEASTEIKRDRQMAMVKLYRKILKNPEFIKEFTEIVKNKKNNKLWEDSVDDKNVFYIIQHYKNAQPVLNNIQKVLNIWEAYGWMYFIGAGTAKKVDR